MQLASFLCIKSTSRLFQTHAGVLTFFSHRFSNAWPYCMAPGGPFLVSPDAGLVSCTRRPHLATPPRRSGSAGAPAARSPRRPRRQRAVRTPPVRRGAGRYRLPRGMSAANTWHSERTTRRLSRAGRRRRDGRDGRNGADGVDVKASMPQGKQCQWRLKETVQLRKICIV